MMHRATTRQDHRRLLALHRAAFDEEDLRPLVAALLERDDVLSLAAGPPGDPIAHVVFTQGWIEGADTSQRARAFLLGPLAVAPHEQGQGVGAALVREGLRRLAADGAPSVLVLGDPAYYSRFGFAPASGVATPCPIFSDWAAAWQGLTLTGAPLPTGRLTLPEPWLEPGLWSDGESG